MTRSDSICSVNTINDANSLMYSNAEQKRRCNIQVSFKLNTIHVLYSVIIVFFYLLKLGFERLQQMVPSLRDSKHGKASKAAMLQRTAEYIKVLRESQNNATGELNVYKNEIEQLSDQISDLQNELPENGVTMVGNLNKSEKFRQKYNAYVQARTVQNWKFYLFSLILKPLFETYVGNVSTSSADDLERSVIDWQAHYLNLQQIRPRKSCFNTITTHI